MRLTYAQRSGAGGYADERFERGRASSRKATLRPMLVLALPFIAAATVLYVADFGHRWSWFGGALFGIGMSLVVYARDAVPAYIENWRTGAEAERRTASRLGSLRRRGWTLVQDVDTGHGNYDHVVVGPAGVFLIETKELGGRVRVAGEVVHVDRRHDPDARYAPQPSASARPSRSRVERLAPAKVDYVAAALEQLKREGTGALQTRPAKSE